MVLLEDQHGPEADGALAAATNVDTNALGLDQELVTLGRVPGNEGSLALTTQVLQVLGVLLGETLQAGEEVVAGGSSVLHQVQALNLLDDTTEDQSTGRVTHPGVELTVRLVGTQGRVAVVVTGGLGLLGEGHHVGGSLQVPVVVGPELAGGTHTSLHLINNEEDVVALGDLTQATEEGRGGVVVTTLRLDGLDDNSGDGVVPLLDETLGLLQAALLFLSVLLSVLLQGVLQGGEGSLGPVKGRDVQLVDGLAAGCRQTAEQTTVEGRLEGHDGQLRRTRGLVLHGRLQLLLSELGLSATTLALTVVHKGGLVGSLVGIRAGQGGKHLVKALGGSLEDTSVQDVSPVVRGEVTQSRSVDQSIDHLGRLCHLAEVGVVVADGDGGNLSIAEDDIC